MAEQSCRQQTQMRWDEISLPLSIQPCYSDDLLFRLPLSLNHMASIKTRDLESPCKTCGQIPLGFAVKSWGSWNDIAPLFIAVIRWLATTELVFQVTAFLAGFISFFFCVCKFCVWRFTSKWLILEKPRSWLVSAILYDLCLIIWLVLNWLESLKSFRFICRKYYKS